MKRHDERRVAAAVLATCRAAAGHRDEVASRDARRRIERRLRVGALACDRLLRLRGEERKSIARSLGLSSRTLRRWRAAWREDGLRVRGRGRPRETTTPWSRALIVEFLREVGPGVGLPTLRAEFPSVARAELARVLGGYRQAHRVRGYELVYELRWTRAGAVWASDFSHPPAPIDGRFSRLLATRDLASGYRPHALGVEGEDGNTAAAALEAAFTEHGAPLVWKSDNGPGFDCKEVGKVLARWKVVPLLSPEYWPPYNGSIESGIGSLKDWTHHAAARQGRAGRWTTDDLEAAREGLNRLLRPWGPKSPTSQEAWDARVRITARERAAFLALVRRYEKRVRAEREVPPGTRLGPHDEAAIHRAAVTRALTAAGYLEIRRRKIPPRLFRRKADKNT